MVQSLQGSGDVIVIFVVVVVVVVVVVNDWGYKGGGIYSYFLGLVGDGGGGGDARKQGELREITILMSVSRAECKDSSLFVSVSVSRVLNTRYYYYLLQYLIIR